MKKGLMLNLMGKPKRQLQSKLSVSYEDPPPNVQTHYRENCIVLEETGVLLPFNNETVSCQSVFTVFVSSKLWIKSYLLHLKFTLFFLFILWPFLPEHRHSSNRDGPWARRYWSTSLADPAWGLCCTVAHPEDSWKEQLNGGRTWNVSTWVSPSLSFSSDHFKITKVNKWHANPS